MIYTDAVAADMTRPRMADVPAVCYMPGVKPEVRIVDMDEAEFRIRCTDLELAEAAAAAINAAIGAKP